MGSRQLELDSVPGELVLRADMAQDTRDACVQWSESWNEPCYSVAFRIPRERPV